MQSAGGAHGHEGIHQVGVFAALDEQGLVSDLAVEADDEEPAVVGEPIELFSRGVVEHAVFASGSAGDGSDDGFGEIVFG